MPDVAGCSKRTRKRIESVSALGIATDLNPPVPVAGVCRDNANVLSVDICEIDRVMHSIDVKIRPHSAESTRVLRR